MLESVATKKAQKALTALSLIKPAQWGGINENLKILGGFMDMGAGSVLNVFKDTLVQTIGLKFGEILAPIKNEIYAILNDAINQAIGPIMPYINDGLGWIGDGLEFLVNGLFHVGTLLGTFIAENIYRSARDEAERLANYRLQRAAKARRARYQFGNLLGPGGRGSGLQSGSGAIGPPPDAPASTTSREQE